MRIDGTTWKQAAKENRAFYQLAMGTAKSNQLKWHKAERKADKLLELLREGLEATKRADGHWSDRVRWMNWVDKVEKELGDE